MKIQILILSLVSLVSMPPNSTAQISLSDSLTVEQAVRMTLGNHPAVQQARQAESAAEARVGINRSPYYPDLSITGSFTRIGPVAAIDMPGGTMKLYPDNNYDLHLGLRQTLYDFGKTAASVKVAKAGQESAMEYLELTKFNLAYQAIAVFDAILILHQNIAVLDEQIGALNQHREVSAKKVQAGTATDFDVLTTSVRIAGAENEKIDVQTALANQEILFRQLTGLSVDKLINLKGEFPDTDVTLNPDSLLDAVLKQRPELALALKTENIAGMQRQMASLGDRPSLAFNLTSGIKNGYVPDLNETKANYTAGLLMQIPLFNGRRTHYQYLEAEANLYAARAHSSDIQRQVISEVEQAITGVRSSLEKIRTSEVQLSQAEEALTMAKTRYEAGVITNLDLLDAQTTLSQAKLIRLRALYNYTVNLNILNKATGKRAW